VTSSFISISFRSENGVSGGSGSSGDDDDDDDDDTFQILTAESLFSTLLNRVRIPSAQLFIIWPIMSQLLMLEMLWSSTGFFSICGSN